MLIAGTCRELVRAENVMRICRTSPDGQCPCANSSIRKKIGAPDVQLISRRMLQAWLCTQLLPVVWPGTMPSAGFSGVAISRAAIPSLEVLHAPIIRSAASAGKNRVLIIASLFDVFRKRRGRIVAALASRSTRDNKVAWRRFPILQANGNGVELFN